MKVMICGLALIVFAVQTQLVVELNDINSNGWEANTGLLAVIGAAAFIAGALKELYGDES